jgi:hypothetical protein
MSDTGSRLDDAELETQLSRRASRVLSTSDRNALVASVVRTPVGRQGLRRLFVWPRVLAPLAALSIAIVVATAALTRPPGPLRVGVVHGSPEPIVSTPAASPRAIGLIGTDDLARLLANTAAFDGRVVLSDVPLVPLTRRNPVTCDPCAIAQIADSTGTYHDVMASSALTGAIAASTQSWDGPKAFRLTSGGSLRVLGMLFLDAPNGLAFPASGGAVNGALNGPLSRVIVVHGWLTGTAFPCGPPRPEPTPPPDSPFDPCGRSYLTTAPIDTSLGTPAGIGVQRSAYDTYAPTAVGIGGTDEADYLLGMEEDPRANCSPCKAWRVIGRLDSRTLAETATPNATPGPVGSTTPSSQADTARILTPGELMVEIARVRSSGGGPVDVVADVTIDSSMVFDWLAQCDHPRVPCTAIGLIHQANDAFVVVRDDRFYAGLTGVGSDGPLALRLFPQAAEPIQLLGQVEPVGDSGLPWSVRAAVVRFEALPLGRVLAVEGWLSTFLGPCGPAGSMSGPPIEPPFRCATADVISPDPGEAHFFVGWSSDLEALRVQKGAYTDFAPNPDPESAEAWRFGTYLVQRVANHNDNCAACEGWLMIGRLDGALPPRPAPTPTPGPEDPPHVLSVDELRTLLGSPGLKPTDVVAAVNIDGSVATDCFAPSCRRLVGILPELDERPVWAARDDPYLATTLADVTAPVALHVDPDGTLTFLGHVDSVDGLMLTWSVPAAAGHGTPVGHVLAVEGWLSSVTSTCGPYRPPGYSVDPPFTCALGDVLAPTSADPAGVAIGTSTSEALAVQKWAYGEFAPALAANGPRYGVYLIKWVVDPNVPERTAWLMVGRLFPASAGTIGADQPLSPDNVLIQEPSGLPTGTVANVRGWLSDTGAPIPCPAIPTPTSPPDSPWSPSCRVAWIATDETAASPGWQGPASRRVYVQPEAYSMFAPAPTLDGTDSIPRFGTYSLVLIRDPRFPTSGARGWQVIGRLEP